MQEGAGVNLSVGLISGLSWIAGRATLCPMSTSPRFIHLRLHTEYSLLEGAMRLKKLPQQIADLNMPAVAVTDTNNMFCGLEFAVSAQKAGLQPIMGCQVDLEYVSSGLGEKPVPPAPIVLLAQTEAGYENLMKLNEEKSNYIISLPKIGKNSSMNFWEMGQARAGHERGTELMAQDFARLGSDQT